MRGQIGVEHVVILGVVLVILIPGIYVFYNSTLATTEELDVARIVAGGNKIIDSIETLNALGSMNKKTILLDMPESFKNMTIIGNNTLLITFEDSKGISQLVFYSKRQLLNPSVGKTLEEIRPGKTKLAIQNIEGSVCLSYEGGSCGGFCGNGIVESEHGEVCDGADLDGNTCTTFGYKYGSLICASDCKSFLRDLCNDCSYIGPVCLDQNLNNPAPLLSDYVPEVFGNPAHLPQPEIGHGLPAIPFTNFCGVDGTHYMHNGGGLRIDFPGINETGDYLAYTKLLHIEDPGHKIEDISIQCEGEVSDFQDNSLYDQEVLANCYIDNPNPDIRIIAYNDATNNNNKLVRAEEAWLIYNCGSRCHAAYDSGFECLARGLTTAGSVLQSDFLTISRGPGNEGDSDLWDDAGRSGPLLPEAYEDACVDTFYFYEGGPHNNVRWEIKDFEAMLDPTHVADETETYELFLNIIWSNEVTEAGGFDITCGNTPPVRIQRPLHIIDDSTKLVTHKGIFCDFLKDGNDMIVIDGDPSLPARVEFERFKFRRACN